MTKDEQIIILLKIIQNAVEEAWQSDVIDTGMFDLIDETKKEWIDNKILEWKEI